MKKKLGLKILGLVVFSLLLAVNCAEDGTAPNTNLPPNTLITNYQISVVPVSGDEYAAAIYWSGSDVDGAVPLFDVPPDQQVCVVGASQLAANYALALQDAGHASRVMDGEQAALAGLAQCFNDLQELA